VERDLPEHAWYVWVFEGGAGWACEEQDAWRSVIREPNDTLRAVTARDIAFLQYGSYAAFDEGLVHVERIGRACRMCREKGIRGLMLMGELAEPSNLINYMALDFFLRNPQADILDCLQFALAELRPQNPKRKRSS
jgi:hypothetical protein